MSDTWLRCTQTKSRNIHSYVNQYIFIIILSPLLKKYSRLAIVAKLVFLLNIGFAVAVGAKWNILIKFFGKIYYQFVPKNIAFVLI